MHPGQHGCEPYLSWQAHAAIREDPKFEKKERKTPDEKQSWKPKKLTYDERKASLKVSSEWHHIHSATPKPWRRLSFTDEIPGVLFRLFIA